jgi:membrane-associated phospholipid phosphatase
MTVELEDLPAEDLSPWRTAGPRTRQRRRRMLLVVVVAFTTSVALAGVPTGREWLTLWILVTLLAAVGGEVAVWRRAVVRDWLPLLAVLFAYDLLRGVANEIGGALFSLPPLLSNPNNAHTNHASTARAHLLQPLRVDRWLFGGHVPTAWLQQHLYTPGVAHWWDRLAVVVYLSHFLVSLILAIVLWCVNYPLFRRYLSVLVTLTLVTLTTYVLYPAAPPWMAALNGKLPPVDRVVQSTLHVLGSETVNTAVEKGAAYSNPVAAMPSLHAAIPMMLCLFFWSRARAWVRALLLSYALAMAVTLVYTGEHYVVDVLLGWVYAAGTVLAVNAVRRRLAGPSS